MTGINWKPIAALAALGVAIAPGAMAANRPDTSSGPTGGTQPHKTILNHGPKTNLFAQSSDQYNNIPKYDTRSQAEKKAEAAQRKADQQRNYQTGADRAGARQDHTSQNRDDTSISGQQKRTWDQR